MAKREVAGRNSRRASALAVALTLAAATPPALAQPAPGGAPKGPAPAVTAPARPGQGQGQGQASPNVALSAEAAARTPPLQANRPVQVVLRRTESAFFRVDPAIGEAWEVVTRRLGRDTDTVLAVLDERGETVIEDDDGGSEGLASRIEVQPGDGARLVRAGTLGGEPGRFEVVASPRPVLPPPDFATTREEAASRPALTLGQPVRVRLRRNQQAFFVLPEDRRDVIAVTRDLGRGTDTVLALLDGGGNVLAEDDDGGRGLASLLSVAREAQGPLVLRAGLISGGIGTFEVMLEREAPTPPPDYPTTLEAARARGPVAAGQTIRVELGRRGQAIFALPEGQPLTVTTRNLSNEADTVLALLDAEGAVILEDDDGGDGLASRVTTADAARPAAFVRATLLGGNRGAFDIAVAAAAASTAGGDDGAGPAMAASHEEAATRPAIVVGEAVHVRLEAGREGVIALPFDGRPAVAMTFGLGQQIDTVLELLDASGNSIAENDDAEGLASRLEVPAEPRPAFLRVRLLENRAGEFNLVLVRPAR